MCCGLAFRGAVCFNLGNENAELQGNKRDIND